MFERIIFALKESKTYRSELRHLKDDKVFAIDSVNDLDLLKLKQLGINILVLDFDGVLAAHGERKPLDHVENWLIKVTEIYGGDKVYILSNKPTEERLNYFKIHFPQFQFISGVRKKPYPDGLKKVIGLSKANPSDIALVDDRLLTGALAALIAGVKPIYIKKALSNYKKRPIVESFFKALRLIERLLV